MRYEKIDKACKLSQGVLWLNTVKDMLGIDIQDTTKDFDIICGINEKTNRIKEIKILFD